MNDDIHKHYGYQGHELKPFTGRPGAMDAFSKPSIVNGQQVPRKEPTIQLTGNTKESTFQRSDK
jgi:hypothetical protein